MYTVHPLTLAFHDPVFEREFIEATSQRTRLQGQTAIVVGMFVYVLCGLMDQWFVPADVAQEVWNVRFTVLAVPVLVLILSLTPAFERLSHLFLALVGLAAGVGLITIQMLLPTESTAFYYPIMLLVTFYTYNFVGTRFIYAFCIDLFLLLCYNLVFGWHMGYPGHILAAHDIFIISANLIGGAAGYLSERQRRMLFLREIELDKERRLHMQRALHDSLTDLPNRDLLYDRISQSMASARRDGSVHCGFFLDLDGFKAINDTLGHKAGDMALQEVAHRLSSSVRQTDTVARIGGDEFFVLALNIGSESAASAMARMFLERLSRPILGVPAELSLSASIGMCMIPYEGMSTSDIIHRADEAMYQVKCSGKADFIFAG